MTKQAKLMVNGFLHGMASVLNVQHKSDFIHQEWLISDACRGDINRYFEAVGKDISKSIEKYEVLSKNG